MSTTTSGPGGAPFPEGIPKGAPIDPQQLAELANAFFKAGPGQPVTQPSITAPVGVQTPGNPAPAGSPLVSPAGLGPSVPGTPIPQGIVPGTNLIPASPTQLPSLGYRAPALLPHSEAGNGVPDNVYTHLPAYSSEVGQGVTGVPPLATSTPSSSASSGYYFVADDLEDNADSHPARAPLSLNVPQEEGALDYLAGQALSQQETRSPTSVNDSRPHINRDTRIPGFYFLDSTFGAPQTESPQPHQPPGKRPELRPVQSNGIDIGSVRSDFPILQEQINGHQLVWFDNGATTHKPQVVIDRLSYFYRHENSNIHRAAHELAARATDAYEGARESVRRFINAPNTNEIIFTRGTTESINLVAKSWGSKFVGEGDEIIISHLEHHANIVPWQQLAAEKGAIIKVIPVNDRGELLLKEYARLLSPRTRIVSVAQVSNVLGTVTPVEEIVALAHGVGARVLIDGAQSVAHHPTDVQAIGADFFVFSGHKIFAPTGIGALWGKKEVLEQMPPWQSGGNMIADVTFERTLYQPIPNTFEAGTGNIADAIGLGTALDYVSEIGVENISRYEHELVEYASSRLASIPGLRLIGTAPGKAAVISFTLDGYSTDEVGQALNKQGIAVRTGHHCAQPILRRFGVETAVRASLAFYNTTTEIDRLVDVIRQLANEA